MDFILRDGRSKEAGKGAALFAGLALLSCAAVVGAHYLFVHHEKELYEIGRGIVEKTIYGRTGHPYDWQHYLDRLSGYVHNAQTLLDPSSTVIREPVFKIGLCLALVFLFMKRWLAPAIFSFAAAAFLVIDLYTYSFADVQRDYASYRDFFAPSGVVTFLKENLGTSRYFNYTNDGSNMPLAAAKNMIYGLRCANAYSPLALRDYYDLLAKMGGVNDSTGYPKVDDAFFHEHLKILGLLNIKYIVSDRALDENKLKKVYSDGRHSVYENPELQGETFFVSRFQVEPDRRKILGTMLSAEFDPKDEVLIEAPSVYYGKNAEAPPTNALIILKNEEEERSFQIEAREDSVFLLSSVFDSSWRVWVDGEEAKLVRADAVLTALPIKQGSHTVEMKYQPDFILGRKR